ncbi:(d)CMP kinase [Clostridium estertheticum]|uniref:Cytidylate kinase n=1 Tax=Clostridium estertheticum subsp. estertheticum TaxID=1552 RepID=A0A1J0GHL4_9CLOT|nr:(d)CMP kinase [Clostridium estertheticum]APC40892.1 cytidylate kinase [Clostridium estertheticum subsp. estertheticum]MBU3073947.1 (d)CMP kinase [Clostridium estertheticum]MBU3164041.1 (d)CMP kinase [Clostridium estertheticum]MBU3187140.1 (d)CMP kinase [Clostridium estertheticum]MBZ9617247.1 (d)CMP kinase [Clostridium estertheticum subsp. laramiense]
MEISIAIDGPAGAGKSTIAKMIGKKFNLMYINTGSMYRAVTLKAMDANISENNVHDLVKLVGSLEMHFVEDSLYVNNEDLTNMINMPNISNNVSKYAAVPEIREILVKLQKDIAKKFNVIMDGRDIGTVVLKEAPFKFYLTASSEERAKRRYEELMSKGIKVDYNTILNDIIKRDFIDTHREVNPLTKASDAVEIDSSDLDIDGVVNVIVSYINSNI